MTKAHTFCGCATTIMCFSERSCRFFGRLPINLFSHFNARRCCMESKFHLSLPSNTPSLFQQSQNPTEALVIISSLMRLWLCTFSPRASPLKNAPPPSIFRSSIPLTAFLLYLSISLCKTKDVEQQPDDLPLCTNSPHIHLPVCASLYPCQLLFSCGLTVLICNDNPNP